MLDTNHQDIVAKILIDVGSIKFSFDKPFTLTSGEKSPVYVDCRKLISFVEERNKILSFANKYLQQNNIKFDLLAGGETAGIPYSAFLAEILQKPMIYIRKKPKGFGNDQQIEGNFNKGQKALLIEDLATDGGSKINFIKALRKSDLKVSDILVIFYYNIFDINKTTLGSMDIKIHSLCTWKNIFNVISENKLFTLDEIDKLKYFLSNPEIWRKNIE